MSQKTRKRNTRRRGPRKQKKSRRIRRKQSGGDGSWKMYPKTLVTWRDRREDPYAVPMTTTKADQEEMTEYY